MFRSSKTPLAWLNLVHDKRRLLLSVAGVAFAVLLVLMEMGFMNALLDSNVLLLRKLNADWIILSKQTDTITGLEPFARSRLYRIRSASAVRDVFPIYVDQRLIRNPANGTTHFIRIIAYNPEHPVIADPKIGQLRAQLQRTDTILFDTLSKAIYGPIVPGVTVELNGKRVEVAGTFELGADFSTEGNVIMSARNYSRLFTGGRKDELLGAVHLGLVRTPAADRERVGALLQEVFAGQDLKVVAKDEVIRREISYWETSTPIGFIFQLGAFMGFAVGAIICYQILYTDVSDHLPQFATLKAMGYSRKYLLGVVLSEALILAVLGFLPAVLSAYVCYSLIADATGLCMELTPDRATSVFVATWIMCLVAGTLAARKVLSADPADLF